MISNILRLCSCFSLSLESGHFYLKSGHGPRVTASVKLCELSLRELSTLFSQLWLIYTCHWNWQFANRDSYMCHWNKLFRCKNSTKMYTDENCGNICEIECNFVVYNFVTLCTSTERAGNFHFTATSKRFCVVKPTL